MKEHVGYNERICLENNIWLQVRQFSYSNLICQMQDNITYERVSAQNDGEHINIPVVRNGQ